MPVPYYTTVQYETIAENVSVGVLLEGSNRKIKFVNHLFLNIFNISATPETLIDTDCMAALQYAAFLFTQPYEFLDQTNTCVQEGEKVLNQEWLMADGRTFLRDYIPVYTDALLTEHLWLYKEVTEVKRLEEQNKHLKLFYERILDKLPIEIAVFNTTQTFLYANEKAIPNATRRQRLMGRRRTTMYDEKPHLFPLEKARHSAFLDSLITGEKQEFIEQAVSDDPKYYLRSVYPMLGNQDEEDLLISFGLDITQLVQKENELRDSNSKLDTLINALDEALVIIRPDYTVEYANPAWEKIFGVSTADTIGKKVQQFFTLDTADQLTGIFSHIRQQISQKERIKLQITNNYLTTKVLTCLVTGFNHQGVLKFSCLFTDITAIEKSAEELTKLFMREKDLNEIKSGFVNMVSHELRTPLSIIQSSAEICEMIADNGMRGNEETVKEYLSNITGEVERITKLLTEVLMVSKIEAGKIEKNIHSIDLYHLLVAMALKFFSPWQDRRSLHYTIKMDAPVYTDPMMVEHIISNLLQNAFKYSANKPAPICRIKGFTHYWCFTVVDFGIGIKQTDVINLGQPFFRGANVGETNGTGLGLTIVQYFARLLDATILVRSSINKGSVFYVKFPYEKNIDR